MMLGSETPPVDVLETVTGSPFGMQLVRPRHRGRRACRRDAPDARADLRRTPSGSHSILTISRAITSGSVFGM
ncbi:hypothetical protein B1H26_34670 [Amycolatopsis sp. BJA-103]|nr:hypothetical protein B1H26_34670 [Amycolatopsis sp. BJA-103]